MSTFWRDRSGAAAVYSAFVGTLMIGSAVLALDFGRLTIVQTQMQNAADAAATAASMQLDGSPGACARAEGVARATAAEFSKLVEGSGTLSVDSGDGVTFLSQMGETEAGDVPTTCATNDANFVRVRMSVQNINLIFMPILNMLSQAGASTVAQLQTSATATGNQFLCQPVQIMVCAMPGLDLMDPANAGREVAFVRADMAAGGEEAQFRSVCPPSDPECDLLNAWQYEVAQSNYTAMFQGCTAANVPVAQTPPDVRATFNPRLNIDSELYGADSASVNVQIYPADGGVLDGQYGDGNFNAGEYWSAQHGGAALPQGAPSGFHGTPSRFAVYLYEIGESFWQNGSQTVYPIPAGASPPSGFATVQPSGTNFPTTTDPNDAADKTAENPNPDVPLGAPDGGLQNGIKRTITAAVVPCDAVSDYSKPVPSNGRFVEMFMTRQATESTLYGELIGPVDIGTSQNLHLNARLAR